MAITDLTGTTWYIASGWSATAGYGRFKIFGTFTADSRTFPLIDDYTTYKYSLFIGYVGNVGNTDNAICVYYKQDANTSAGYLVYNKSLTDNTAPFTISITGGTDVTNADLIAWLYANGELQVEEKPTTITYNGNEIASLESGQIATLSCNGKVMQGDIIVAFGADGSITYNGVKKSVASGQTATLSCKGKIMKSDVVVKAITQLAAPTISLDGSVISITNNNDVSVRYNVYVNGEAWSSTVVDATSVDLSTFALDADTYSIYLTAFADGYEESEQSNAVEYVVSDEITDLTGTTWHIPSGWTATAGYGKFVVNFTSWGEEFNRLNLGYSGAGSTKEGSMYYWFYGSNLSYHRRDIALDFTFTGGTDATNASLISWLYANGELQ